MPCEGVKTWNCPLRATCSPSLIVLRWGDAAGNASWDWKLLLKGDTFL